MSKPLPRSTPAKKPIPPAPSPAGLKKPVPAPVKPVSKPAAASKPAVSPSAARNARAPVKKPAIPSQAPKPKAPAVRPPAAKAPSAPPAPGGPVNWLNREVQSRVAGVGSYAGGLINSVGNGVNAVGLGIGNRIADTTRYWGQGVSGYGNDLKDSVGAAGPRVATAGNPLGLAGPGQGRGTMRQAQQKVGDVKNIGGGAVKSSAGNPLGL